MLSRASVSASPRRALVGMVPLELTLFLCPFSNTTTSETLTCLELVDRSSQTSVRKTNNDTQLQRGGWVFPVPWLAPFESLMTKQGPGRS